MSRGPARPSRPAAIRSELSVAANDFVRQWDDLGDDALRAVDRVGRSGWLVLGEEVAAFEAEIAEWWGVQHAVGVASGLDAIAIGLRCAGVSPGDRVLTTPLTAFATTLAIVQVGAVPVWVDVDETGGLDLDAAAAAARDDRGIRAVVPVHLYGHPLDPERLRALAQEFDLAVVEDCAQSAGAERGGAPTGLAGRVAATSLYPTKNLGAMGDGGIVLTADEEVAAQARSLRDYGQRARYEHVELGLNSRLDELQAAILRSAQLPRLDGHLARRSEIAARYTDGLRDTSLRLIVAADGISANHLYPVEVEHDSATAVGALRDLGIGVGRHYPFVCPDQPAAAGIGSSIGDLKIARRLAECELSLPIHPYLDDEEVETVIAACREVFG